MALVYLWETTRKIWEEAAITGAISPENRALARLAHSAAVENARRITLTGRPLQ